MYVRVYQVVGNKTAKIAKKNGITSAHHKKRTLKAKTSSATAKDSPKSKTTVNRDGETAKSKVSADAAALEAGMSQTIADTETDAKKTADPAAKAEKSKAYDNRCTEATKSEAVAETTTGVVDTAATTAEGDDDLPKAYTALPPSTGAQKPNVIFIDSINSFRYSSQWYSPSKVLP